MSVYLKEAYIKHARGVCHIAGKTNDQRSEVTMEKAEHYFRKTHTRGHDCQLATILVSPTDRIGRVVVHYVQFLGLFCTVKVKLRNKWIYRNHKHLIPKAHMPLQKKS